MSLLLEIKGLLLEDDPEMSPKSIELVLPNRIKIWDNARLNCVILQVNDLTRSVIFEPNTLSEQRIQFDLQKSHLARIVYVRIGRYNGTVPMPEGRYSTKKEVVAEAIKELSKIDWNDRDSAS